MPFVSRLKSVTRKTGRIRFHKQLSQHFQKVDAKKLEEGYKSFSYEVPIPGLREIATARHWILKLTWSLFLLCFVALTIYFLIKIVNDLINEPTNTKIKYVINQTYSLPSIYICLQNWRNDSHLLEKGLTSDSLYFLKKLLKPFNYSNEVNITRFDQGFEELKHFSSIQKYSHLFDIIKEWSWTPEECKFSCSASCVENVEYIANWKRICYKINFPDYNNNKPKYFWRAFVTFKPPEPEDAERIFIQERPRSVDEFDMLPIKPGINYDAMIDVTRRKLISKCDNSEAYDLDSCFDDCSEIYLKSLLNCSPVFYGNQSIIDDKLKRQLCMNYTGNETNLNDTVAKSKSLIKQLEKCYNNCLPGCDSYNYHLSIYPTTSKKGGNDSTIELSFKMMYVKTGILTYSEEAAYSWETAVSNIGGQLSLWLGFSVVTFVQVTLYWCRLCIKQRKMSMMSKKRTISKLSTIL